MRTNSNTVNLPPPQSTMREINGILGTVLSTSGLLAAFSPLAFHMMMTFYLVLIGVAIVAGKNGTCPSLMTFFIVWHLFSFPAWILRSLVVKACKKPVGMLICFVMVAFLFFVAQPYLITAAANIKSWIKGALAEMTNF
jgi:hypothetical protein